MVLINFADVGSAVGAAEGEVEVAVVIVVAPRGGGVVELWEFDCDFEEVTAVVVIEFGRVGAAGFAGEDEVEVAVVIVVAPGCGGTVADSDDIGFDVGEAAAVVAVDFGDSVAVGIVACDEDVEVAVSVVVRPLGDSVADSGEVDVDFVKGVGGVDGNCYFYGSFGGFFAVRGFDA